MKRFMPIVLILLAIALFFGYVRPTWDGAIAADNAQIASYNSALDASAKFSAQEAKLEQGRNALPQDQLDRLSAFLPDNVNNVQLILDLNSLANKSGMVLSNFNTSSAVNGSDSSASAGSGSASFTPSASPIDSLTLTVAATGTYDSFRSFLAGVEQSLRPLDVEGLVVADSATGVYTYQMTLEFYWLH